MKNNASFVEGLLRAVPELRSAYEEHVADNNHTMLAHVFMGDVTRFVIALAEEPRSSATLARLLEYLETGLRTGGQEVKELIAASFVENLLGETNALQVLKPMMGPNLRSKVEAVCGN